jgi:hypothetical protein
MIILKCVSERNKLRVKFHCFINEQGITYTNVYNNRYNCRFPKDLRRAGLYYKVNDTDIRLTGVEIDPFYSIKGKNIKVMTDLEVYDLLNPQPNIDLSKITIFDAGDCVICLSTVSEIVFIPCAHQCVCSGCNNQLKTMKYCCPVCRTSIKHSLQGT